MTTSENLEDIYDDINHLLNDICKFLHTQIQHGRLSNEAQLFARSLVKRSQEKVEVLTSIAPAKQEANKHSSYLSMERANKNEEEYVDPDQYDETLDVNIEEDYANIEEKTDNIQNIPPVPEMPLNVCPYYETPYNLLEMNVKKYGTLFRKERRFILGHKRQIFVALIENWILIYYPTKKNTKPIDVINTDEYVATRLEQKKNNNNLTFELCCPSKMKYEFIAGCYKEMEQWIAIINNNKRSDSKIFSRNPPNIPLPALNDSVVEMHDEKVTQNDSADETELFIYENVDENSDTIQNKDIIDDENEDGIYYDPEELRPATCNVNKMISENSSEEKPFSVPNIFIRNTQNKQIEVPEDYDVEYNEIMDMPIAKKENSQPTSPITNPKTKVNIAKKLMRRVEDESEEGQDEEYNEVEDMPSAQILKSKIVGFVDIDRRTTEAYEEEDEDAYHDIEEISSSIMGSKTAGVVGKPSGSCVEDEEEDVNYSDIQEVLESKKTPPKVDKTKSRFKLFRKSPKNNSNNSEPSKKSPTIQSSAQGPVLKMFPRNVVGAKILDMQQKEEDDVEYHDIEDIRMNNFSANGQEDEEVEYNEVDGNAGIFLDMSSSKTSTATTDKPKGLFSSLFTRNQKTHIQNKVEPDEDVEYDDVQDEHSSMVPTPPTTLPPEVKSKLHGSFSTFSKSAQRNTEANQNEDTEYHDVQENFSRDEEAEQSEYHDIEDITKPFHPSQSSNTGPKRHLGLLNLTPSTPNKGNTITPQHNPYYNAVSDVVKISQKNSSPSKNTKVELSTFKNNIFISDIGDAGKQETESCKGTIVNSFCKPTQRYSLTSRTIHKSQHNTQHLQHDHEKGNPKLISFRSNSSKLKNGLDPSEHVHSVEKLDDNESSNYYNDISNMNVSNSQNALNQNPLEPSELPEYNNIIEDKNSSQQDASDRIENRFNQNKKPLLVSPKPKMDKKVLVKHLSKVAVPSVPDVTSNEKSDKTNSTTVSTTNKPLDERIKLIEYLVSKSSIKK